MGSYQNGPRQDPDDGYLASLLASDGPLVPDRGYYDSYGPNRWDSRGPDPGAGAGFSGFAGFPSFPDTSGNRNPEVLSNFDAEGNDLTAAEKNVVDIFRDGGLLSAKTAFFRQRKPQIQMVTAILNAVKKHRNLVVEAGTGTGKTFAYLIPPLKQGRRVIVSTRTLNLQDQLLKRDIQHIQSILGESFLVAALKGRSNYICLSRLDALERGDSGAQKARQNDIFVRDVISSSLLHKLRDFLEKEPDGDLTLLSSRDFDRTLLDRIAAHSYSCLGSNCPFKETCKVSRARLKASEADVLIVNHNIMLQNYLTKERLFPVTADVVIFDEAHHLPSVVRETFTDERGSADMRQIRILIDDMRLGYGRWYEKAAKLMAKDAVAKFKSPKEFAGILKELYEELDFIFSEFARDLYFEVRKCAPETSYGKDEQLSAQLKDARARNPKVLEYMKRFHEELNSAADRISSLDGNSNFLRTGSDGAVLADNLVQLVGGMNELLERFIASRDDDLSEVFLISSTQKSFSLKVVHLDVAGMFSSMVLGEEDQDKNKERTEKSAGKDDGRGKTSDEDDEELVDDGPPELPDDDDPYDDEEPGGPVFVFASATITVQNSFHRFTRSLGIRDELFLRVSSPFDYRHQGFFYVPEFIPAGKTVGDEHARQVVQYALPLLSAIDGGFLILCTSVGAMNRVYDLLSEHRALRGRGLFSQARTGKTEILRNMQRLGNAVTVATSSFWEGVDIPGSALSCVIIDRLPFRPMDTMQKAVSDYVTSVLRQNSFMELSLPEMIISLKQGVGRLIRSEKDFGVVAIADDRIARGPAYGRKVISELPPFATTGSVEEIRRAWLEHVTKIAAEKTSDADVDVDVDEILDSPTSDDIQIRDGWTEEPEENEREEL